MDSTLIISVQGSIISRYQIIPIVAAKKKTNSFAFDSAIEQIENLLHLSRKPQMTDTSGFCIRDQNWKSIKKVTVRKIYFFCYKWTRTNAVSRPVAKRQISHRVSSFDGVLVEILRIEYVGIWINVRITMDPVHRDPYHQTLRYTDFCTRESISSGGSPW